jgi:putative colanic acid biosynthesis acetyltransferase WcaF
MDCVDNEGISPRMPIQTTPTSAPRSPPSPAEGNVRSPSPSPAKSDTADTRIFQRLDTVSPYPYPLKDYVRRALWEAVQATLIRLSPRRAHGWRAFWLRVFGADLARSCYLKNTTRVRHPWLLKVGRHSAIAEDVNLYNLGPITIGDHSVISQGAHLCAGTHDYTQPSLPLVRPPITIGSGVWVCAEAFIGPNVTVGDNAIVGARAVVMKDVPANMIVAGNPAEIVRERTMPVQ